MPTHTTALANALASVDEGTFVNRADGTLVAQSSSREIIADLIGRLELRPGMTVCEIGTGSGYSTALLAHLVGREGHVVSMDVVPELVDRARMLLSAHGYTNTTVLQADGMRATPARAPFDRLAAWATTPHLPTSWVAQLAPEGLIVAPMLLAPISKCGVGTRIRVADDHGIYADQLFPASFVEMHDEEVDQWLVPPHGIDALCRDDAGRAWWLSGTWLRGHEGDSHGWHLLDSLIADRHEVAGPLEVGERAGDFRAWLLANRPDGLTTAALGDPTWHMGYAHSSSAALTDMRTATRSIASGDPDAADVLTTWANAWRRGGRPGFADLQPHLRAFHGGWTLRATVACGN